MEAAVLQLVKTVDKLDGKVAKILVKLEDGGAEAGLDNIERKRKALDGKSARVKVDIDKRSFADAANAWAMLSRNMQAMALPAAIALATPTILDLANATGVAAQSLLLLPAAGAAAGAVMGTVKVGVSGVGDALKQVFAVKQNPAALAAALAQLSPEARQFVVEIQSMKGELTGLKIDVQNALFRGLSGTLHDLGGIYLPIARTGLAGIASELNASAQNIGTFLRSAESTRDVSTIFANTREMMSALVPAAGNIIAAFLDIATVGSDFLPQLGQGFTNLTERLDNFIAHARATGQLHDWIQQGLDALKLMIQFLINVGQIIAAVMRAANTDTQGFLTTLVGGSAAVRDFLNSAKGQNALSEVFTNLRSLVTAIAPLLGAIALAIVAMFNQLAPALPPLIKGLTDVFAASGPLLGVFSQLAIAILPALGAALSFLAPVLGPLVVLIGAAVTATKIYGAALLVVKLAQIGFAVAQAAYLLVGTAFNVSVAASTAGLFGWARAQALLNAVMALNPIGLVVVAVVALAAALIYAWNNSETFRKVVTAAWNGIKEAASVAWAWLQGIFASFMEAVHNVGQWFTDMGASISRAWADITTAAGTAWGWLVANVWQPMVTFFTVTIPAAWNGLVATVQAVWNGIITVLKYAVTIILTVILFPLMLFINEVFPGGLNGLLALWKAIWQGMLDTLQSWWNFAVGVWNLVVNFLTVTLPGAFNTFFANVTAGWNQLASVLHGWWDNISALWNMIIGWIGSVFYAAFQLFWGNVTAGWNQLMGVLHGWWDNISALWNTVMGFLASIFAPKFTWFRTVVSAEWTILHDAIMAVWNKIRDNIWNPMVKFITETIPQGFQKGVDLVGRLWNGIKAALRTPLQAAIDIVWNNGIVKVWNEIAHLVNLDSHLDPVILGAAASGRVVDTLPGYTPGRDPYTFYSPGANAAIKLGGGESIMRPEFTRAVGASEVNTINAVARKGGVQAVQDYLAYGGESLQDFGSYADGAAALNWAKGQVGKPYIWGGTGPRGFDCSGFQSAVSGVALGYNPYARRFSTGSFGPTRGAGGFVPGIDGSYAIGVNPSVNGGAGHMAGTLMGVNIESSSGPGVRVGGGARGAADSLFPWKFHLNELGGRFAGGVQGPSILDLVSGVWKSVTSGLGQLGGIGGGTWGKMAGGFLTKVAGTLWDWIKGKAEAIWNGITGLLGGGGGGDGGARGWIIQHESGGNPKAQNPTSSASGLYQMIDATWRAYGGTTAHAKDASVAEQDAVANRYVAARYGSWENAQAFWQAHHYYDSGGYLYPGSTMAMNATGGREKVLDPVQTKVWDAMAARPRGGDGGELLGVMRALNANLMALRGDVDHHPDQAGISARLDMTNRLLAGAMSGSSAVGAQAGRTIGELGPF